MAENNTSVQRNSQMSRLIDNIKFIKENIGKIDEPIMVELLGTPKSGKTTLVTNLESALKKGEVPVDKKRETAEYNPIEDKTIEEYNLWMIMELMKNLTVDTASKEPKVIIYDRGLLDRIPWLDTSVHDGSFPAEDARYFKGVFQTKFMEKYRPITYGFITSPEISILRKGKPGRLVNNETLTVYNAHLKAAEPFLRSNSEKFKMVNTDVYQGRIGDFVVDVMADITTDVRDVLVERINAKKKSEGPDFEEK